MSIIKRENWSQRADAAPPLPEELTVMIEIKKYGQKHGKGDGKEDVADIDVPEVNKPATIPSRKERFAGWQGLQVDGVHPPYVNESGKEDDGKRGAIILNGLPDRALEKRAAPDDPAEVRNIEDQERYHNGQVSSSSIS